MSHWIRRGLGLAFVALVYGSGFLMVFLGTA